MAFFNIFNKDIHGLNPSTFMVTIEKNFSVRLIKYFCPYLWKGKRKKKWIFIINKKKSGERTPSKMANG